MKGSTNSLLLLAIAGLGLWYFTKGKATSRLDQLNYLNNWADSSPVDTQGMKEHIKNIFVQMTDQELSDTYTFIHDYPEDGNKTVPVGSALQLRLIAISNKYNIFT